MLDLKPNEISINLFAFFPERFIRCDYVFACLTSITIINSTNKKNRRPVDFAVDLSEYI